MSGDFFQQVMTEMHAGVGMQFVPQVKPHANVQINILGHV